jgi:hypothetical protein
MKLSLEEYFKQQPFETRDYVMVTKIEDINDVAYLQKFIGKKGLIISYQINNDIDRVIKFKVRFDDGETYYFLGSEMVKIN